MSATFGLMVAALKRCTKCGRAKPVTDFHRMNASADRLQYQCKACDARLCSERRARNPQHYAERRRQNTYGISPDEFTRMRLEQCDFCAICSKPMTVGKGICVDHDHKTGTVRGLLCQHCNTLLGAAKDQVETLWQAIRYLQKHESKEGTQ